MTERARTIVWTGLPYARSGSNPCLTPECDARSPGSLGPVLVSRDAVLKALEGVIDPELGRPVMELDMVRDVTIEGGNVGVTIALTVPGCPLRASFEEQVDRALAPVEGVESVALSFDVMSPDEKAALTARLRGGVAERTPGISVDAKTRVIAVASGKGGVGKSTLTANLAAAFSTLGHRTGVLDADVYGFSIPTMLGIQQRPVTVDKMIVPPVRGDLKVMSIGFFLDENTPIMWRGPMLHRALEQFLSDVHWGELDTLVVDMPPGTGDVAISLGQLLPRAEAVVVTTPHRAAQQVAVRAAQMARKTNMRLLGVVENMSHLVGSGEALFGSGGGETLAAEVDAPLLGRIPFDPRLGALADEGEPMVLAEPDAEASLAIIALADAVAATKRERGVGIVKSLPLAHA
jgi:ATP-binding protein involved in chromosome partitioning